MPVLFLPVDNEEKEGTGLAASSIQQGTASSITPQLPTHGPPPPPPSSLASYPPSSPLPHLILHIFQPPSDRLPRYLYQLYNHFRICLYILHTLYTLVTVEEPLALTEKALYEPIGVKGFCNIMVGQTDICY